MRIAIFTDTFYPKNDGMSTSSQHLAATLADQGHQVLVVAPKPSLLGITKTVEDFALPGVQIVWLSSIPAGLYPQLRLASWSPALHKALSDFNPEIVHAMSPLPVSLTGIAYAKRRRLPVVMTFHTYFMDPEYLKIVKVEKMSKFVEELGWDIAKVVHAKADVTIAPTDFVADDLHRRQFKEPILVIPSGVDINKKPADKDKIDKLIKKFDLSGQRLLVTVGRVSVEKNLDGLIRVLELVKATHPDVHLVIVGDGPDRAEITRQVAAAGLSESVTFTGDIAHEQIFDAGYYQLGEFFVTASLSETQGMTSVEAQMCGQPVVAFWSKGLPFVVGEAGVLVAENDEPAMAAAINDLLDQPAKLAELRRRLPANLRRFDIQETTRRVTEAYQLAATIQQDKG